MHVLRLGAFPSNQQLHAPDAFITHGLALTHILPLSRALAREGVKSTLFCGEGSRYPKHDVVEGMEVFRTSLSQTPLYLPYGASLAWNRARIVQEQGSVDVLHAHNPAYAYALGLAPGLKKRTPLVITMHGTFPHPPHHGFLLKRLAKSAEAWIAISEPSWQQLLDLGVPAKRLHLIPTGVDLHHFTPGKKKREGLLFVGRLVESKNVQTLLDALPVLAKIGHTPTLTIIGDGPLRPVLQNQARALGIEKQVRFLGSVPQQELPQHYKRAQVFVAPHLHESFGKTLIEGMACGTPVVGTTHDLPLGVKNAGLFYPFEHATDVGFLADTLRQLLEGKAQRTRYGKAGRKLVEERFSWRVAAAATKKVYESL